MVINSFTSQDNPSQHGPFICTPQKCEPSVKQVSGPEVLWNLMIFNLEL